MTNGSDRKEIYGLLGQGINYSLSPAMHNAAFNHFGISAEYVLFNKEERELDDFFADEVLGGNVAGFNVTVPYKIKTKEFLEREGAELGNWVRIIGALNTVKAKDNKLAGYNTDAEGFYDSLKEDLGLDFGSGKEKTVFIAGAGGAGRAIALFLAHMGARKVYTFDIDAEKLESLQDAFNGSDEDIRKKFCAVKPADEMAAAVGQSDLVVNATPLGTHEGDTSPVPADILKEGQAVYDLVYARETELLKAAKEKGLISANGLGMLVNQAARAFEVWTGKPFDSVKDIMRQAAFEEMKKR